jgi:hypothetical protein
MRVRALLVSFAVAAAAGLAAVALPAVASASDGPVPSVARHQLLPSTGRPNCLRGHARTSDSSEMGKLSGNNAVLTIYPDPWDE